MISSLSFVDSENAPPSSLASSNLKGGGGLKASGPAVKFGGPQLGLRPFTTGGVKVFCDAPPAATVPDRQSTRRVLGDITNSTNIRIKELPPVQKRPSVSRKPQFAVKPEFSDEIELCPAAPTEFLQPELVLDRDAMRARCRRSFLPAPQLTVDTLPVARFELDSFTMQPASTLDLQDKCVDLDFDMDLD
eukprot:gnl/Spiro4/12641_TR6685_c0_g1_i1.p1 gnl/Spiro4/12641_TR6685_c0_g1~~gnl/Spiro4/12641_TR6685_c0_g1_i1.p1  ORF type:complete len:190 (+),score=34.18 gnl/Spiro4/12641_TR6685_c0_g1_i1:48-617(+)